MEPEGVDRVSHAEIDSTLPGSSADAHATQCSAEDRATDQGTEPDLAGYYKRAHVRTLFHKLDGWIVRRIWSHRFRRWRTRGWLQLPQLKLYEEFGLVNLISLIPSLGPPFGSRASS